MDDDYYTPTIRIAKPKWPRCRVQFSLLEFLLVLAVFAPLLAIWRSNGIAGITFVIVWLLIGIPIYSGIGRVRQSWWRLIAAAFLGLLCCLACGLVFAVVDYSLITLDDAGNVVGRGPSFLSDVAFHLPMAALIGTACGLAACLTRSQVFRSASFGRQHGVAAR